MKKVIALSEVMLFSGALIFINCLALSVIANDVKSIMSKGDQK